MKSNGSRAYNVWTEKEEQALRSGVKRYGVGAWEMIRQDKDFTMLKKRSGVQLKDKWRNLVKFRKLDEEELRNLPTRASGPWSRRSQRGREQENNPNENEGGYQNRPENQARTSEDNGVLKLGFPDARLRAIELVCRSGDQFLNSKGGGTSEDSGPAKVEDEDFDGGHANQRRSARMCGRSPLLFTDYLTDFEEADAHGGGLRFSRRTGNKRANIRLEDRRFGIYDVRRYMRCIRSDTQRTSTNDSTTITNDASDNDSYVVDCPCGVTYDDGQMMIECECCKAWAHVDCLKVQMDQISGSCQYSFNAYICEKCRTQHRLQIAQPAPDQGSSISDEDIWHPLSLALVPKGKRLRRRKRAGLDDWCAWLRPLYPHVFPASVGHLVNCTDLGTLECKEGKSLLSSGFTAPYPNGFHLDMPQCPFGGMSVSMVAQLLTQQIRHWMDSESAAQLVAALASMSDPHRMLLPSLPFPGGVGYVTPATMATAYLPAGIMPEGPPLKRPHIGNEIPDGKEFGLDGQGASGGQLTQSNLPALAPPSESQKAC